MNRLFIFILLAVISVTAEGDGQVTLKPLTIDLKSGFWQPKGRYSTREGNILRTDVPEGKQAGQQLWMERTIDLRPFRGREVTFLVRYRSSGVSLPPESYNGIKFMLIYSPAPAGALQYPGGNGMHGDSDGWKWTAFSAVFPETVTEGTLCMGLQNSFGKVEFDLDSLQAGTLFSPDDRINSDWKVEYPANIMNLPRLRGIMSPHTMTPEDISTLGEWNVDLIRAQLSRNWGSVGTELDLDEYDCWLDGKLNALEKAMQWGQKHRILFVIDLHCPPGGRNTGRNMRMFTEEKYGDHFIKVWERIAKRFSGNPQLYAYNLVNEPLQTLPSPAGYDYWNLQRRAAEAIRAIDPATPIMVESNMADKPETFAYLSPFRMHNIIYKVHMYLPESYTHQRLNGSGPVIVYPGIIENEQWDRARIRKELEPVVEFQKRHACRIYVGEFSAITWAPGAEQYLSDCIEVFEELGWDWTYHSFREWGGWSLEHTGPHAAALKPSQDNPRKRVLLNAFKKNAGDQ